jgi:hypothetical protein
VKSIVELINELKGMDEMKVAERFHRRVLTLHAIRDSTLIIGSGGACRLIESSRTWMRPGVYMVKALARKPAPRRGPKTSGDMLRLGDLDTRIRRN